MTDIFLGIEDDIAVSENGDIALTESIRQAILIRLRWFYGEWRLGPQMGFPWFEEVLVKNPNIPKIKRLIRNEIMQVEGVKAADVTDIVYQRVGRSLSVQFSYETVEDTYREEVTLYAGIRHDA